MRVLLRFVFCIIATVFVWVAYYQCTMKFHDYVYSKDNGIRKIVATNIPQISASAIRLEAPPADRARLNLVSQETYNRICSRTDYIWLEHFKEYNLDCVRIYLAQDSWIFGGYCTSIEPRFQTLSNWYERGPFQLGEDNQVFCDVTFPGQGYAGSLVLFSFLFLVFWAIGIWIVLKAANACFENPEDVVVAQ